MPFNKAHPRRSQIVDKDKWWKDGKYRQETMEKVREEARKSAPCTIILKLGRGGVEVYRITT